MRTNRIPVGAARALTRLGIIQATDTSRRRQLGQVLPIFAVMSIVLLGGAALLTDVAWWWTNELRMKSAADAASLAGAVYLPNDESRAFTAAFNEAQKNGYLANVPAGSSPGMQRKTGAGGLVITARRDLPDDPRKLIVDISAPVNTNFARVFCWQGGPCLKSVQVGVTGAAEYVLPVPMGSPENYYGVFGMTRGLTTSRTVTTNNNVPGWSCNSGNPAPDDNWLASSCEASVPTQASGADWASTTGNLSGALTNDSQNSGNYARGTTPSNNGPQTVQLAASNFDAQNPIPTNPIGTLTISGLQVRLTDVYIDSACAGANINVDLSWNGGTNWTTALPVVPASGNLPAGQNNQADYILGSPTSTTAWDPPIPPNPPSAAHTWVRTDFTNTNFRVRLTASEDCNGSRQFFVDRVDVRVKWTDSYTTSTLQTTNVPDQLLRGPGNACFGGAAMVATGARDCFEADGQALNPRGFWATMNTQGAENVNGDAYQPGYDTRTNQVSPNCPVDNRACYDGVRYYNYAVEMPPDSTSGAVYIYDPQFCDVPEQKGTGDRWFGGDRAVGTFYEVFDTNDTLYDQSDDTRIAYSDATFRGMDYYDPSMSGSNQGNNNGVALDCRYRSDTQWGDGRDYHSRWYQLYSGIDMIGGPTGHIYRIHTTSTDPASTGQQLGTNGENSFAIYASGSTPGGGSIRVYGLGAMQAFTPLVDSSSASPSDPDRCAGNTSEACSEFYLAQIEEAHAGKTIEIRLWDPGDTQSLRARLQVLIPTATGWTPTNFTYTANTGTANGSAEDCHSLTNGTNPVNIVQTNAGGGSGGGIFNGCWLIIRTQIPADYTAEQDGWWRIRYRMDGNDTSFDVTTWQVNLIGNPVHLVMP